MGYEDSSRSSNSAHRLRYLPPRPQTLRTNPRILSILHALRLLLRCLHCSFLRLQCSCSNDPTSCVEDHPLRPDPHKHFLQMRLLPRGCWWRATPLLPCNIVVPGCNFPQNHQATTRHEPIGRQPHHPPQTQQVLRLNRNLLQLLREANLSPTGKQSCLWRRIRGLEPPTYNPFLPHSHSIHHLLVNLQIHPSTISRPMLRSPQQAIPSRSLQPTKAQLRFQLPQPKPIHSPSLSPQTRPRTIHPRNPPLRHLLPPHNHNPQRRRGERTLVRKRQHRKSPHAVLPRKESTIPTPTPTPRLRRRHLHRRSDRLRLFIRSSESVRSEPAYAATLDEFRCCGCCV